MVFQLYVFIESSKPLPNSAKVLHHCAIIFGLFTFGASFRFHIFLGVSGMITVV